MKQLKTVKIEILNISVLYRAYISQRVFNTFGVIPDDIIINFIYKIIVKVKSYQISSPIALFVMPNLIIYYLCLLLLELFQDIF